MYPGINFACLCLCREPDIPAWAPLLYQLQLLDIRDKPDPETLPIADRIRIGNQKRERGNFHFQREEYSLAARAYYVALEVLTTHSQGITGIMIGYFYAGSYNKGMWTAGIECHLTGVLHQSH